jgi:hypothetical protein
MIALYISILAIDLPWAFCPQNAIVNGIYSKFIGGGAVKKAPILGYKAFHTINDIVTKEKCHIYIPTYTAFPAIQQM